MATSKPSFSPGLEGVPIAESALSLVEGTAGRLTYRGYSIEDVTGPENTFEEIVALIYDGELPSNARIAQIRTQMEADRALTPARSQRVQTDVGCHPARPGSKTAKMCEGVSRQGEDDLLECRLNQVLVVGLPPSHDSVQARVDHAHEPIVQELGRTPIAKEVPRDAVDDRLMLFDHRRKRVVIAFASPL